jgi:glycosyltransferase involved in cell wall biosynthesis
MPPVLSGIADCSAELVGELRPRHHIDVYVDTAPLGDAPGTASAHEFVWRHRINPYDLTVYQVGNSSHHDYLWPYLFRYPGLTVLHDAHLHHARAAQLLRTKRAGDYRAEFAANHPHVHADLAELAVAGFDNHLYYSWPMTRLVVEASKLTAVHTASMARELKTELPHAAITSIRLAHGTPITDEQVRRSRARVRGTYGLSNDSVVFGVFGGLTPEKRIPAILEAFAAVLPYAPAAHLLLAGAAARHYDVVADVRDRGLASRVTATGYVDTDEALTECIAACDVSLNLRWPTAREMSGPWLRALAAGRPTITIDLAHMVDVPSLDPRTWRVNTIASRDSRLATRPDPSNREPPTANPDLSNREPRTANSDLSNREPRTANSDLSNREPRTANRDMIEPVCVAIDILDEQHSLRLAMRRLATDPELRATLGAAGRRYWEREHSMPQMLEDYERILADAAGRPAPHITLPHHLVTNGDRLLNQLLEEFSVGAVWE